MPVEQLGPKPVSLTLLPIPTAAGSQSLNLLPFLLQVTGQRHHFSSPSLVMITICLETARPLLNVQRSLFVPVQRAKLRSSVGKGLACCIASLGIFTPRDHISEFSPWVSTWPQTPYRITVGPQVFALASSVFMWTQIF